MRLVILSPFKALVLGLFFFITLSCSAAVCQPAQHHMCVASLSLCLWCVEGPQHQQGWCYVCMTVCVVSASWRLRDSSAVVCCTGAAAAAGNVSVRRNVCVCCSWLLEQQHITGVVPSITPAIRQACNTSGVLIVTVTYCGITSHHVFHTCCSRPQPFDGCVPPTTHTCKRATTSTHAPQRKPHCVTQTALRYEHTLVIRQ